MKPGTWGRYIWRRVIEGGIRCRYLRCGHRQVGYSAWCREHTDRILTARGGESAMVDSWPRHGKRKK